MIMLLFMLSINYLLPVKGSIHVSSVLLFLSTLFFLSKLYAVIAKLRICYDIFEIRLKLDLL